MAAAGSARSGLTSGTAPPPWPRRMNARLHDLIVEAEAKLGAGGAGAAGRRSSGASSSAGRPELDFTPEEMARLRETGAEPFEAADPAGVEAFFRRHGPTSPPGAGSFGAQRCRLHFADLSVDKSARACLPLAVRFRARQAGARGLEREKLLPAGAPWPPQGARPESTGQASTRRVAFSVREEGRKFGPVRLGH